ncbi:MAG: diadenylate cyclase [Thermoplasmata archaeon]|nr:diadenylate cyclase [Thermoplasmata archaeon]
MDLSLFMEAVESSRPDAVVLFEVDPGAVERVVSRFPPGSGSVKVIIASSRSPPSRFLVMDGVAYRKISSIPSPGLGLLSRVREFFVAAMGEGLLHPGERVLCLASGDMDIVLDVNTSNLGVSSLIESLGERVDIRVIEAVMDVASEVAREGKEGYPAGALFIVGDEQKVMMQSREMIRTPFNWGGGSRARVMSEEDKETVKRYATMDGALVLDSRGHIVSAGRYVMVQNIPSLALEEGLGGRHLAAAYITRVTGAVAVVVSSSGVIRVFKDGGVVYEVKNV